VTGRRAFAACGYAAHGWAVFPLNGKRPATSHGVKDATTDLGQVERWWSATPEANIGVACGAPSGDLLVVDLDGEEGFANWQRLQRRYAPGLWHDTLLAATGGGGAHLFYRCAEPAARRNTTGKLGSSIDTRGDGGYVVVAPSIHPETSAYYKWGVKRPINYAPAWLVALLVAEPEKPAPVQVGEAPRILGDGWVEAMLVGVARDIQMAPAGQRNHTLNRAAWRCGKHAELVDEGEVRRVLEHAGLVAGLTLMETRRTIDSGWSSGLLTPATRPPDDSTTLAETPASSRRSLSAPRISAPRIFAPRLAVPSVWSNRQGLVQG